MLKKKTFANLFFCSAYQCFFGVLFFLSLFFSCKKEFERPQWDVDLLAPLLKSSLTLNQIVADSLTKTHPDSTISVMYNSSLYHLVLDSFFVFPDTLFTYNAKLDSLILGDISISYPISLGSIAQQLIAQGNFTGTLILLFNGKNFTIPSINSISSGDIAINAQDYFQSITLQDGYMDITIQNDFPVDIKNVQFELSNAADGTVLVLYTFPYIVAGDSQTVSISLAGKTIEGDLIVNLLNLDVVGSAGAVPIDTSDKITASLTVRDLKPSIATAIFPSQEVVNKSDPIPFALTNVELTKAIMKGGTLKVEVFSTIKDSLFFRYQMPSASLNGKTFDVANIVPPAPTNGVSTFLGYYDFKDYVFDMKGINGDTVNTMFHSLIGSIDSSGIIRNISLSDSFYISVSIYDLEPLYVEGYMGQHTFDIGPDSATLAIFKNIKSGTIDIENVSLTLSVENGIGADAGLFINSITSVKSSNGKKVDLIADKVINTPITINRATDNPFVYAFDTLILNNNNSNIKELIENLPDILNYTLQITTNPNGNSFAPNRQDFIYSNKLIDVNLQMELPLSVAMGQLKLIDTVDVQINKNTNKNISNGNLVLLADNGFPLDVDVQLYLLDNDGMQGDSLFTEHIIAAAPVDANNKVKEKKRSKLLIPVNETKMTQLTETKRMLVVASFTSSPINTYLKMYSHYSIDIKLVGDFSYRIE